MVLRSSWSSTMRIRMPGRSCGLDNEIHRNRVGARSPVSREATLHHGQANLSLPESQLTPTLLTSAYHPREESEPRKRDFARNGIDETFGLSVPSTAYMAI